MAQILEKNKGLIRAHAGNATLEDGEEIDLAYTINGSPVVEFEDGTIIYWTWEELIGQAMRLKNS